MPLSAARIRGLAADLGLDRIQLGDALERLRRDRRAAALGDVVEAATEVAPAEGERQRSAGALGIGQRVIGTCVTSDASTSMAAMISR